MVAHIVVGRDEVLPGDEFGDGYVVERTERLRVGWVAYLVDGGARFLPPEVIVRRRQTTAR